MPLAIDQHSAPDAPGGHQQTAGHTLGITASQIPVSGDEGHIFQQMGGEVPVLLLGQFNDLFHLHTQRLIILDVLQLSQTAGFIAKMGMDQ